MSRRARRGAKEQGGETGDGPSFLVGALVGSRAVEYGRQFPTWPVGQTQQGLVGRATGPPDGSPGNRTPGRLDRSTYVTPPATQ